MRRPKRLLTARRRGSYLLYPRRHDRNDRRLSPTNGVEMNFADEQRKILVRPANNDLIIRPLLER